MAALKEKQHYMYTGIIYRSKTVWGFQLRGGAKLHVMRSITCNLPLPSIETTYSF